MRLLVKLFFVTVLVAFLPALHAQTTSVDRFKDQTFALGVQMGIASFESDRAVKEGSGNSGKCYYAGAFAVYRKTMNEVFDLVNRLRSEGVDVGSMEYFEPWCFVPIQQEIENKRESIAGVLSHRSSVLAQAYNLGVSLGIAEGQATAGEPGRPIVSSALSNAQAPAQALGMDMASLTKCTALTAANSPMDQVHEEIVAMRIRYQEALKQ